MLFLKNMTKVRRYFSMMKRKYNAKILTRQENREVKLMWPDIGVEGDSFRNLD